MRTPSRLLRPTALAIGWVLVVSGTAHASGYRSLVPTDQADGRVWAIVEVGGVAYFGGEFTHVVDHQGNTVPRARLAAINLYTGRVTGWNPGAEGNVYALATDGTRIFVGGDFHSLGGQAADRLGAVNLSGNRIGSWQGRVGYVIRDLAVHGTTLYVAGAFGRLNGVERSNLGALRTTDGSLLPFDPNVGGPEGNMVRSIAVSPSGDRVFLGGYFEQINGAAHYHMGAVDAVTGATKPWSWHPERSAYPDDMQANSTGLFVGFAAKGTDFHGMGSYTLGGGNPRWVIRTCGDVQDLELRGGIMYIGGHLRCVRSVDIWPIKGTGAVQQADGNPVAWGVTANIGCSEGCLSVWDMQFCDDFLCVGGDFSRVNGVRQAKIAKLE